MNGSQWMILEKYTIKYIGEYHNAFREPLLTKQQKGATEG
jgi:hypothetical protein